MPEATKAVTDEPSSGEAAMIARILAGEHELFHGLIRPYEKGLYFAAFSLLRNVEDAEDAVQEAVMKAYKALPTFAENPSSAPGWAVSC